ncbi:hypothetical protein [Bacillus sp. PK3_68]|uniref:hypothetical protein n=1 Tax=Bacillus sp. PK3_68 TaxID=2027408 RepID=UPI00217D5BF7|nr:hypothetical protein [Bacillus sp. PK3_68]
MIYPVSTWGGYQLIGMSAVPVFHQDQILEDFKDSIFLAQPGDLWKHRSITESEYHRIANEVEQGTYRFQMKNIQFSPEEYFWRGKDYILELMEGF